MGVTILWHTSFGSRVAIDTILFRKAFAEIAIRVVVLVANTMFVSMGVAWIATFAAIAVRTIYGPIVTFSVHVTMAAIVSRSFCITIATVATVATIATLATIATVATVAAFSTIASIATVAVVAVVASATVTQIFSA